MLQFAPSAPVPDLAYWAMIEQGIDMPVPAFGCAPVSTEARPKAARTHIQVPAMAQKHEIQRSDGNYLIFGNEALAHMCPVYAEVARG